MKKILLLLQFLVAFSLVNGKECHSLNGWKGYFSERLSYLDQIEGIYDIQSITYLNNQPVYDNGVYAIARLGGNLFRLYEINGNTTEYFIERIGETPYYYLTYLDGNRYFKDRFVYTEDGTFTLVHELSNDEKSGFINNHNIRANSFSWVWKKSAIKTFPTATTVETTLEPAMWSGTGFSLGHGYIATNHHVAGEASLIKIYYEDDNEKTFNAHLVVTDPQNDIAILKVDDNAFRGNKSIPYMIKPQHLDVSERCFLLGFPRTDILGRELKFTEGSISSWSGYQGDPSSYQISAPSTNGNSGGPTFDKDGNVIGILNSGIPSLENVSYSIKSSYLYSLIESKNLERILPTTSKIQDVKDFSEKIKELRKYVYYIVCTNAKSWDAATLKENNSPFVWELPKPTPIVAVKKKLTDEQRNEERLKNLREKYYCIGSVRLKEWNKIKYDVVVWPYIANKYQVSEDVIKSNLYPIFEETLKKKLSKKFNTTMEKGLSDYSVKAEIEVVRVDNDGEIYGIITFFSKTGEKLGEVYFNGNGGKGDTLIEMSEKAMKKGAKDCFKILKYKSNLYK